MKLKELINIIDEDEKILIEEDETFKVLYEGYKENLPKNLNKKEIINIAAAKFELVIGVK